MFPRFLSIPSRGSEKFVDLCLSELLLYKTFRDMERDIGDNNDTIISNWESLNYTPWHVERTISTEKNKNISDSEI